MAPTERKRPKANTEQEESTKSVDWWSGSDWPNAAAGNASSQPTTEANTKNLAPFINEVDPEHWSSG